MWIPGEAGDISRFEFQRRGIFQACSSRHQHASGPLQTVLCSRAPKHPSLQLQMAMVCATSMMKSTTRSASIALELVRAASGCESVDGAKSRQGWASMVKKLKVYVRSAKVCVTSNALLGVKPCDGALEEFGLVVIASLRLELCGRDSVSWLALPRILAHRRPQKRAKKKAHTSVTHTGRSPAIRHMSETKVLKSSKRDDGLYCQKEIRPMNGSTDEGGLP